MKKIKDKPLYIKLQKRRFLKTQERARFYKEFRSHLNTLSRRLKKEEKYRSPYRGLQLTAENVVDAPNNLLLNSNTNQVLDFIRKIENKFNAKKPVFVNLNNVQDIDSGAIILLLSIMIKFKSGNIEFNGNFPKRLTAIELLRTSGFFESLNKKEFQEEDNYEIAGTDKGGILTHANKRVDPILAARLIETSSLTIWKEIRRCQGVYRVLIELMQNTNNHAEIGKPGEKHWWLSVNHTSGERKVRFAFVDLGVGIFESLAHKPSDSKFAKWKEKFQNFIEGKNNPELLRLILSGNFHFTVTGLDFRGKGLPGIFHAQKLGQISGLRIITNDTYCCPSENSYVKLSTPFIGTFVYWEVNKDNVNCKSN